jgi:hypothetical protein
MAAQTSRARGMSFPPDDSFGWLDDLYAVPSTGESDDGCLLFFDPKNARRIFYVHINRLLVHIDTFDPVHIGLLLSAKLTTAWTVQFHLPFLAVAEAARPVARAAIHVGSVRDSRQIERHSAGRPRGLARSLADVRFAAHSGLKSDIALSPKGANMRHGGDLHLISARASR